MRDDEQPPENQARIRVSTSVAEVVVEGGEGETVGDIEETASRAFDRAVLEDTCEPDDRHEEQ